MSMNTVVYGEDSKVKSKGDIRLDRMWARWRERNTQAAATVALRERHIKDLEQRGEEEDWSNEVLESRLMFERRLLREDHTKRLWLYAQLGWLGMVTCLAPMLIPVSNWFDAWMNSPAVPRR
tara:strand:+ start:214 stop:579 length:366 start_codon:yes stop_codon:yes gene_type:complete